MKYPWLYDFLAAKPGVEQDFKEEWQWTRFMINGKLFAAICKDEQGLDSLLTVKLLPEEGDFLRRQFEDIIPGYYMNKTHWNSVKLEGTVPDSVIKDMADKSYDLILKSLPKKRQREILGEA